MIPSPRWLRTLGDARLLFLLVLLGAAIPLVGWPGGDGDARAGGLDAADDEWEAGRPRQAALLLREVLRGRGDTVPADLLRLARAEAGWGNHGVVVPLLEGRGWLDGVGEGEGWRLLAGALEAREDWSGAAAAWSRALSSSPAGEIPVVALRRAGALIQGGNGPDALAALESLPPSAAVGEIREWVALELLRRSAASGDTTTLRQGMSFVAGAEVRERSALLPGEGWLRAGDTLGAMERFSRAARGSDLPAGPASDALSREGELRVALGDTAGAVTLLRQGLARAPTGSGPSRSARLLLELDALAPEEGPRAAAALEAGGDPRRALVAWEGVLSRGTGGVSSAEQDRRRLRRARLLVATERGGEARQELEQLASSAEATVAVPALELLIRVEGAAGRSGEVRRLEERLLAEHPGSAAALSVVFFRADAAHDRDELPEALSQYRRAAGMAPSQDLAGLSRMRWGQLLIRQGDHRGAAQVFEEYLERFPTGRRWDEAAYWAARSRQALGEQAAAAAHAERILAEDLLGYYALRLEGGEGAGRLQEPTVSPPPPAWVPQGVARVHLLRQGGFHEGARVLREGLERREAGDVGVLLSLAEAFHGIGLHLEGVNLGYVARREGAGWDLRLARIIYPFPLREMVLRESRDRGVDPWLVAALIRQESAFTAAIESGAGAVGFMQILPATGRELAGRAGVEPWSPALLRIPEVNVHLGTHYLVQLLERHGPDLALVLSAYNAGPTRANRWRELPERTDQERFIERIPFGETRGYVKNILRNAVLYQQLYAGQ